MPWRQIWRPAEFALQTEPDRLEGDAVAAAGKPIKVHDECGLDSCRANIQLPPIMLKKRLLGDAEDFRDLNRRNGMRGRQFDNPPVRIGRAVRRSAAFARFFDRIFHDGLEKPLSLISWPQKKISV